MSVRAKMSCGSIDRGQIGTSLNFSAVYEGSEELQGISENAIFGKATPAGWLNIVGPADADRFKPQNEYYVDMVAIGGGASISGDVSLVKSPATLVYRSDPDTNNPEAPVQFRYGMERPFSGMLDLRIANPAAIAWLDGHRDVDVMIREVRGRRSTEEIALREAEVERMAGYARDEYGKKSTDRYTNVDPTHSLEEHVARRTEPYRRKLFIAKGERP